MWAMKEDLVMDDRPIDRLSKTLAMPLSRRQTLRLVGGSMTGAALAVAGITGLSGTKPAAAQGVLSFPINFVSGFGSFLGSFDVTEFVAQGGRLLAVGTLTGEVFDAAGNSLGLIDPQELTLPVTQQIFGTCDILHLELGPLNLDLLGLHVHLNRVVLDITATRGSLLGDLLCAIANLLNGGGPLSGLAGLLNQIFGLLGGV